MKPMLAVQCKLDQLKYPLYASPKLDGVRGVVIDGVLHSRSLKKFPNQHVHALFSKPEYSGLDGELILGSPTAMDVFRVTSGACQRHDGAPDMKFYVFDRHDKVGTFRDRWVDVNKRWKDPIIPLRQVHIGAEKLLLEYETECLEAGYEGLILRAPDGPYKFGRSTLKEGWMLKMKNFVDNEYEIIGFEERMHNGNEATTNELGRTKRSSAAAGKVGRGDLGSLILQGEGFTFNVGTGFDDALRGIIWKNRKKILGKFAKVKHFPIGGKEAPRFPVFLGFREQWDMS